jgi:hypothetical protein
MLKIVIIIDFILAQLRLSLKKMMIETMISRIKEKVVSRAIYNIHNHRFIIRTKSKTREIV